jgi:CTP:molybdopterin cytidylyltransferase MocA
MSALAAPGVIGILLAAGRGTRFGGGKLLRGLAGERVGIVACRHLVVALPRVIALADMPWILPSTIGRVAAAVADGASVAAPFHRGQRGHPVGFSSACYAALAALAGDEGAKSVVAAHIDSLARIDVDDAGTLRDIDHPADLDPADPVSDPGTLAIR